MSRKTNALKNALRATRRANLSAAPASSELGEMVTYAATHSAEATLIQLGSGLRGLAPDIVAAAGELAGPNVLEQASRRTLLQRLASAFVSPFTLILAALAAISLYTNVYLAAPGEADPSTAILIAVMVVVSGSLAFVQESKGEGAADALREMVSTTCRVVRLADGSAGAGVELPMSEVVPGDVIRLSAGDLVPADLRIVSAKDLFVNQAALTGESEPQEKTSAATVREGAAPLDLQGCGCIAFCGTTVQSGSATGVAVATGAETYLGRVAKRLGSIETKTAFDEGVASVSRVLVVFMLAMCPVVFVACGLTKGNWLDALLFSISIAVGITPQMLPVIVTTCLSRGAVELRGEDVVVKELSSIQNLGSIDVLCCDKTGTLTEDRVVLERHLNPMGVEDLEVLRHAYVNSSFQTGLPNLIDRAVIERTGELAAGADLDRDLFMLDELPFDFERRRMSVVVGDGAGKSWMVTKGAVEEMLACCSFVEVEGEVRPLSAELVETVREKADELGDAGLRVVAVARKDEPRGVGQLCADDERDMVLVGYLAFLDPPKASAAAAIAQLHEQGVDVKVLTGDNERVAAAVCAKVGVDATNPLLGSQIDALGDEQLARRANETGLLARLSPLQKERVVRVLREQAGRAVGFMGDGINDAAAMRAADVGISVDTAVDVAKESAGVILLKKDLMVLARGIRTGRRARGNATKYVKLTCSSNFGNALSVLVASLALPFLPMGTVQLLLLGLVSDLSLTALPWDNVDERVLASPGGWNSRSITSFMLRLGPVSTLFDLVTFAVLWMFVCPAVAGGSWAEVAGTGAEALFVAAFQTGWFIESMWSQALVVQLLRSEAPLKCPPARPLLVGTLVACVFVTALPYVPVVGDALGLVALPAGFALALALVLAAYLVCVLVARRAFVRRNGSLL